MRPALRVRVTQSAARPLHALALAAISGMIGGGCGSNDEVPPHPSTLEAGVDGGSQCLPGSTICGSSCCGGGEVCQNETCVPVEPPQCPMPCVDGCLCDRCACASGYVCAQGTCSRDPLCAGACKDTSDCMAGEVCAGRVCAKVQSRCDIDSDCAAGSYCCADGCAPTNDAGTSLDASDSFEAGPSRGGVCVKECPGSDPPPPPPPPPCEDLPDVTVKIRRVCSDADGGTALDATVCNRGTRKAADVRVAFFSGAVDGGRLLCVATLTGEIAAGVCAPVSCTAGGVDAMGPISAEVNPPDPDAGRLQECNYSNNESGISTPSCPP